MFSHKIKPKAPKHYKQAPIFLMNVLYRKQILWCRGQGLNPRRMEISPAKPSFFYPLLRYYAGIRTQMGSNPAACDERFEPDVIEAVRCNTRSLEFSKVWTIGVWTSCFRASVSSSVCALSELTILFASIETDSTAWTVHHIVKVEGLEM